MRVTRRDILPKTPKAVFTTAPMAHAIGTGSQGGFVPSTLAR
jgi:hypothetical protein